MKNLPEHNSPFYVTDIDSDTLSIDSTGLNGGRLFCTEGNATLTLNDITYYLVANSSIALMPGADIRVISVSKNFKGRKLIYTFEFFEAASKGLNGLFRFYFRHPFYIRTRAEVECTYSILDILRNLPELSNQLMTDRAVCLLRFLLMGVCEKIPENDTDSRAISLTGQIVFQRFIFLLAARYTEVKSVEGYAELLRVTPKHLNSVCRKQTGSTAKAVIDNTVLSHIKAELMTTDQTISEIAFLLNFNEPTEMCRFFRRIEGISPGQWREQAQK